MKKKYLFISGVIMAFCCLVFLLFFIKKQHTLNPETLQIEIKNKTYTMQVARTAMTREKGLSQTKKIPHDGMVFIFPHSGIYSFWMKDMNYPIDILWVNEKFEIVEIRENVYPGTYPEVFTPQKESIYVLETSAGFVEQHGIQITDTIRFK